MSQCPSCREWLLVEAASPLTQAELVSGLALQRILEKWQLPTILGYSVGVAVFGGGLGSVTLDLLIGCAIAAIAWHLLRLAIDRWPAAGARLAHGYAPIALAVAQLGPAFDFTPATLAHKQLLDRRRRESRALSALGAFCANLLCARLAGSSDDAEMLEEVATGRRDYLRAGYAGDEELERTPLLG